MNAPTADNDRFWQIVDTVCSGTPSQQDLDELAGLLQDDTEAQRLYLAYCQLHASLGYELRGRRAGKAACESTREEIQASEYENLGATASSPPLSLLSTALHGTIGFFSQELPFALFIATVITSLGLLVGSMIYVTHHQQLANTNGKTKPTPTIVPSKTQYVGQVTGMIDVHWADESTAALGGAGVPLGRKYAIASGLMEITYDTGAKVILQGPVTYEVDSPDSGFLSLGKLTAKLEKRGERRGESREKPSAVSGQQSAKVTSDQWSVASEANPKSQIAKSQISNPQSLIPNPLLSPAPRPQSPAPLFAVRTPTAIVTDLGTEFGVEVKPNGRTTTKVFLGEVVVQPRNGSKKAVAQGIHLKAGQTVYLEADRAEASVPTTHSNKIPFARSMPLQTSRRIVLFKDDASRVARVFGFNDGDWTGEGWRLGGKKTFFVRCGMHSSVPPRAALMDTEDRCWMILPGTTAVRDFGCNLPIGGAFIIDLDPDRATHGCSMGFGLGNSAEKWLFEFAIENGRKTYTIHDNMGDSSDTGIPHTDRGLHLELSRTSENSYWLSVVPLGDHRKFAFQGQFRDSSADSDIRRLRLWNQNGTKPDKSEFYFNNIRVVMPQTR